MIAHVSINVSDYNRSKEFYLKALKPLGYGIYKELPEWNVIGFGVGGEGDLWLHSEGNKQPTHVAFKANDKKTVDEFYKQAIEAGGKDNGAPEYCKDYAPGYYAGFVFDPDGNNVEVVFMDPNPTE